MDQSALIRRPWNASTHRLKIRDSDGDKITIEAKNEPANELGVIALGELITKVSIEEERRADAQVHEDSVSDGGVRWRWGGGGWGKGGGEGEERGGEEEGPPGEGGVVGFKGV